jgi:hypothetical protein
MVSTASNVPLFARRNTVSAGKGAFGRDAVAAARLHGGRDHVDLLAPEIAAVAGVRIEPGDRNSWPRKAGVAHASVRQPQRALDASAVEPRRHLGERNV